MTNQDILNSLINAGYDQYGSWALYDADPANIQNQKMTTADAAFPKQYTTENLANSINPEVMLLALNWADRGAKSAEPWQNFHDLYAHGTDRYIPYMIENTPAVGGYMTDLIKDFPNTKSDEVKTIITNNSEPKLLNDSFAKLQEELNIVQPKLIICFGGAAYDGLNQAVKNDQLDLKGATVIHVDHYAYVSSYDRKLAQRAIIQSAMKK